MSNNNPTIDGVQSLPNLHERAMQAYTVWQDAEYLRDEDTWEAETYAHGLSLGLALDPSLLTPPAPVGAVDEAREDYCRAYDDYYAACDANDLTADDLPDPARKATKPLAWLPKRNFNDTEITEMTNRAIYANTPKFDPPPAEFSIEDFEAWDKDYRILLVNGDDDPDEGPISIPECLVAGAIKAVAVKIGSTDHRLYMVQPGHYLPSLGFRHPGR